MRLDVYLTENCIAKSRTEAQTLIKNGAVKVGGKTVTKPSYILNEESVECDTGALCPYVSRGGIKLKGALDMFGVKPEGAVCLDIGASTGGFTDCLLREGAKKVYAIDSGTSQLSDILVRDSRVVSMENCNARYLTEESISEKADMAVMDVSFISQTKIYPALTKLIKTGGIFISLIKPQFEVGKSGIGKGGIVKDRKIAEEAVKYVTDTAAYYGFELKALTESPITGGDGNREYLACFVYGGCK